MKLQHNNWHSTSLPASFIKNSEIQFKIPVKEFYYQFNQNWPESTINLKIIMRQII